MVVLSSSDRIPVKIGKLEFTLAPLSMKHKLEMAEFKKMDGGEEQVDGYKIAQHCLRYGVKGMSGLKGWDGKEKTLSFDEDGLSDESVDLLMSIEEFAKINQCISKLMAKEMPDSVDGVEVVYPKKKK